MPEAKTQPNEGALLSNLAQLKAQPRATRGPRMSPKTIYGIYEARKRGVSWDQINTALMDAGGTPYKRSSSLAQIVHAAARSYGIEPYITVTHTGKKAA